VGYLEPITKKDFNELLIHLKCIDYSCFNSTFDSGVLESVTALTNSSGGEVFIGVNENKKVIGCFPEEEIISMKEQLETLHSSLSCIFNTYIIKNKIIVGIQVERSNSKIAVIGLNKTKAYYFRLNRKTLPVNKIITLIWKLEQSENTLHFNSDALLIIKLLQENQKMTLSMIYRSSNLALKVVDNTMAYLVCSKKVEMFFENDQIYYKIKD
jgi:predicted HTH transcriptional regulator